MRSHRVWRSAVPVLPKTLISEGAPPSTSRTLTVRTAGGDYNLTQLQNAINDATPGTRIEIEAGVTISGHFTLPNKSGGDSFVVITTDSGALPAYGTRVGLGDAAAMPKIQPTGAGTPIFTFNPLAHNYRLIGIEFRSTLGSTLDTAVAVGDGSTVQNDPGQTPYNIVLDRCIINGGTVGTKRGVLLAGRTITVVGCRIYDCKVVGQDAQATAGWNGPGPFKIFNNYLEASGENVLFGGADNANSALNPADIEIRKNNFFKPLAWKQGDPGYGGTPYTIKNILELKNASRVLIEGNIVEHCWPEAQTGFAILFTVRNQDGGNPWAVVQDVTFRNNTVRKATGGVNMLGEDSPFVSERTRRVTIRNNFFEELGTAAWGGSATPSFQALEGLKDLRLLHNTFANDTLPASWLTADGDDKQVRFKCLDNIFGHNANGIKGTGTASGTPTLDFWFPGYRCEGNLIIPLPGGITYPSGNQFPADYTAVMFENMAADDYRLQAGSPYKNDATDGTDPGVDWVEWNAAQ